MGAGEPPGVCGWVCFHCSEMHGACSRLSSLIRQGWANGTSGGSRVARLHGICKGGDNSLLHPNGRNDSREELTAVGNAPDKTPVETETRGSSLQRILCSLLVLSSNLPGEFFHNPRATMT